MNTVLRREGANLLCYGPRAGYWPLREYLARRMQIHGIQVSPDEIFISNGSQHGLDLLVRILATPGRGVVVEAPTYAMMIPLLRLHGAEIIPISMNSDGMDLEQLERTLARRDVGFVYTMPNFQNPTGVSTTQDHRERLLALCEHHRVPVVEDGFEEEMKYFGKVSLPIKSMDTRGVVIYLGTFSKILMPGLRIGWVAADRGCIEHLVAVRRFADLSPTALLHAALTEFCQRGLYDLHVRRLHRMYRKRMRVTLQAMREHVPPDLATWSEPGGGYLIWVELTRCARFPEEVYAHIAQSGVIVSPGPYYFIEPPTRPCFRLSIAAVDERRIEEGMRRLGRAIRDISGS
jgi:DNA-binding transcriptional MocR family regulator